MTWIWFFNPAAASAQQGGGAIDFRPAHPEEIRGAFGADPGSLGAVGVDNLSIVADVALKGRYNMVTGANDDDFHLRGVDIDREDADVRFFDFVVDGDEGNRRAALQDYVKTVFRLRFAGRALEGTGSDLIRSWPYAIANDGRVRLNTSAAASGAVCLVQATILACVSGQSMRST